MLNLSPSIFRLMTAIMGLCLMAGCTQPKSITTGEDIFSPKTPAIEAIALANGKVMVTGSAQADVRIRFTTIDQNDSIGDNSDDQGRFHISLEQNDAGALYNFSAENEGQYLPSDMDLFIPPLGSDRVALLRLGGPCHRLGSQVPVISCLDYDDAGAVIVSGRVIPNEVVDIKLGDYAVRVKANKSGDYSGAYSFMQALNGAFTVHVKSGQMSAQKEVQFEHHVKKSDKNQSSSQVSAANLTVSNLVVTRKNDALQLVWKLSEDGQQTTLIW